MKAANRVAKNTGILYVRMAITVFISLYSTRLVLSALGVQNFGIFNLVGGLIAMLGFLNASMTSATQRFISFAQGAKDYSKVTRIFNMSVLLHLCIGILVILILECVGLFVFNGFLNISHDRIFVARLIFQFMIVSTFFTIISVPYEALITSNENMLFYAFEGIVEAVLKLLIAFLILHSQYDHLAIYGLLTSCLSIFLLFIRRLYCRYRYAECKISLKKNYDVSLIREMSSFAGWSFLGSASSMLTFYGQGVVINIFFGTIVNAAQGIANQISGQLSTFAITMQKALNPVIAKSMGANNHLLLIKAATFGSKISFILLMLLVVPVFVEMPLFFNFWLKDVPPYAIIFCRLLLLKNLVEQTYVTLTAAIFATGDIKNLQISTSVLCSLPLLVAFIFFKYSFPPYTIYIIFIIYALLFSAMTLYFAKKKCGLSVKDYSINVLLRCFLTFICVFSVTYVTKFILLHANPLLQLTGIIGVSICTLLIAVWFISFTSEERKKIYSYKAILLNKFHF